jgi:type II secretory pathway component PulF
MKKGQAVISGALAIIMAVMAGIVIYLAFVFPKALAIWEQEARELNSSQIMMANFSDFCTRYGLILLPILLLGFLVLSVRMMLTIKKASVTN